MRTIVKIYKKFNNRNLESRKIGKYSVWPITKYNVKKLGIKDLEMVYCGMSYSEIKINIEKTPEYKSNDNNISYYLQILIKKGFLFRKKIYAHDFRNRVIKPYYYSFNHNISSQLKLFLEFQLRGKEHEIISSGYFESTQFHYLLIDLYNLLVYKKLKEPERNFSEIYLPPSFIEMTLKLMDSKKWEYKKLLHFYAKMKTNIASAIDIIIYHYEFDIALTQNKTFKLNLEKSLKKVKEYFEMELPKNIK